MSPIIQKASIAAWQDEIHVKASRAHYCKVFSEVAKIPALAVGMPHGGFYLWLPTLFGRREPWYQPWRPSCTRFFDRNF